MSSNKLRSLCGQNKKSAARGNSESAMEVDLHMLPYEF